jgi:hypothetical protein
MTGIARKIQIATAASAIAAAAAFGPAGVANAQPAAPVPTAGIGDCVLLDECDVTPSAFLVEDNFEPSSIFQNPVWWFGPANPNPPPDTTDFFTFTPLPLIPGFFQPLWGFFTQNLNFQVCIAGLSVKVGPYGTVSGSIGSSC